MSKTRIRQSASDIRPARRSLVELTAVASRAIDDGLLVTSASLIAASTDDPPRSEPAAKTHDRTMVAGQVTAPIPVGVPESLNEAAAHNGELVRSDIRPARRSLVELTAVASRAIDDGLLVTSASLIAASTDDPPRSEPAAKTHDRTMVAGQVTAPIPVGVPESLNEAAAHNGELV